MFTLVKKIQIIEWERSLSSLENQIAFFHYWNIGLRNTLHSNGDMRMCGLIAGGKNESLEGRNEMETPIQFNDAKNLLTKFHYLHS